MAASFYSEVCSRITGSGTCTLTSTCTLPASKLVIAEDDGTPAFQRTQPSSASFL